MDRDEVKKRIIFSQDINKLRDEIERARAKNKEEQAAQKGLELPVALLQSDTNYIKYGLYVLGSAFVLCIIAGWQMFLHLDGKIEQKMDYLNSRVDTVIIGQHPPQPVSVTSVKETTNKPSPPKSEEPVNK